MHLSTLHPQLHISIMRRHEILRQADMEDIDYIFAPIGGGGMIAGIAAIVKGLKPSVQVIGVEPQGGLTS